MPRNHEPEPNDTESNFMDWEANDDLVRKILAAIKGMSVREGLLTLISACDSITKASPKDWENTKIKQVLEEI